jgi:Tfp pilus assembly protein PilX
MKNVDPATFASVGFVLVIVYLVLIVIALL